MKFDNPNGRLSQDSTVMGMQKLSGIPIKNMKSLVQKRAEDHYNKNKHSSIVSDATMHTQMNVNDRNLGSQSLRIMKNETQFDDAKSAITLQPMNVVGSDEVSNMGNDLHYDFRDISVALKKKDQLQDRDISSILLALIHRQRFNYTVCDILSYIFRCACFRDLKENRHNKNLKKHFIFEKCEENLNMELDVVSLLKQARKTRLLT